MDQAVGLNSYWTHNTVTSTSIGYTWNHLKVSQVVAQALLRTSTEYVIHITAIGLQTSSFSLTPWDGSKHHVFNNLGAILFHEAAFEYDLECLLLPNVAETQGLWFHCDSDLRRCQINNIDVVHLVRMWMISFLWPWSGPPRTVALVRTIANRKFWSCWNFGLDQR